MSSYARDSPYERLQRDRGTPRVDTSKGQRYVGGESGGGAGGTYTERGRITSAGRGSTVGESSPSYSGYHSGVEPAGYENKPTYAADGSGMTPTPVVVIQEHGKPNQYMTVEQFQNRYQQEASSYATSIGQKAGYEVTPQQDGTISFARQEPSGYQPAFTITPEKEQTTQQQVENIFNPQLYGTGFRVNDFKQNIAGKDSNINYFMYPEIGYSIRQELYKMHGQTNINKEFSYPSVKEYSVYGELIKPFYGKQITNEIKVPTEFSIYMERFSQNPAGQFLSGAAGFFVSPAMAFPEAYKAGSESKSFLQALYKPFLKPEVQTGVMMVSTMGVGGAFGKLLYSGFGAYQSFKFMENPSWKMAGESASFFLSPKLIQSSINSGLPYLEKLSSFTKNTMAENLRSWNFERHIINLERGQYTIFEETGIGGRLIQINLDGLSISSGTKSNVYAVPKLGMLENGKIDIKEWIRYETDFATPYKQKSEIIQKGFLSVDQISGEITGRQLQLFDKRLFDYDYPKQLGNVLSAEEIIQQPINFGKIMSDIELGKQYTLENMNIQNKVITFEMKGLDLFPVNKRESLSEYVKKISDMPSIPGFEVMKKDSQNFLIKSIELGIPKIRLLESGKKEIQLYNIEKTGLSNYKFKSYDKTMRDFKLSSPMKDMSKPFSMRLANYVNSMPIFSDITGAFAIGKFSQQFFSQWSSKANFVNINSELNKIKSPGKNKEDIIEFGISKIYGKSNNKLYNKNLSKNIGNQMFNNKNNIKIGIESGSINMSMLRIGQKTVQAQKQKSDLIVIPKLRINFVDIGIGTFRGGDINPRPSPPTPPPPEIIIKKFDFNFMGVETRRKKAKKSRRIKSSRGFGYTINFSSNIFGKSGKMPKLYAGAFSGLENRPKLKLS